MTNYTKEAVARKIIESNKRMGIVEQPSSLPKKNSNTNKKKY